MANQDIVKKDQGSNAPDKKKPPEKPDSAKLPDKEKLGFSQKPSSDSASLETPKDVAKDMLVQGSQLALLKMLKVLVPFAAGIASKQGADTAIFADDRNAKKLLARYSVEKTSIDNTAFNALKFPSTSDLRKRMNTQLPALNMRLAEASA